MEVKQQVLRNSIKTIGATALKLLKILARKIADDTDLARFRKAVLGE